MTDNGTVHNNQPLPIDPLKRVLVPIERRNLDGTFSFALEGQQYTRGLDGSIRSVNAKINGKKARKLRHLMRSRP